MTKPDSLNPQKEDDLKIFKVEYLCSHCMDRALWVLECGSAHPSLLKEFLPCSVQVPAPPMADEALFQFSPTANPDWVYE